MEALAAPAAHQKADSRPTTNTTLRLAHAVLIARKNSRAAIFPFRSLKMEVCAFVLDVSHPTILCAAQQLLRINRANPIPRNIERLIRAVTAPFRKAWLVATIARALAAPADDDVGYAKAVFHAVQRLVGLAARDLRSLPGVLGSGGGLFVTMSPSASNHFTGLPRAYT